MKKIVYILTVVLLSTFLLNSNKLSAQNEKPINPFKGRLHLAKSPINTKSIYKTNQEHNTFASNQRPSRYATGKKENIFQRTFARKKRFNKPPKGHSSLP